MNQSSVDHPLSPNEDLESFDRAIGTKTRIPERHGHKDMSLGDLWGCTSQELRRRRHASLEPVGRSAMVVTFPIGPVPGPRGPLKGTRGPFKGLDATADTSLDGLKAPRGRPDPENDRFSAKSQTPLC